MEFLFHRCKQLTQTAPEQWRQYWQSMVPEENRNVSISCGGETVLAFVQMNQFVLMLQDGLLMEETFFEVCEFFQKAGYHVIWLMRCTQDIAHGYLRQLRAFDGGKRRKWLWKRPTTNFGRWTSDNFNATILLQFEQLVSANPLDTKARILQRVTWAQSDNAAKMIPGRTTFISTDNPGTPEELLHWLQGSTLAKLRELAP